MSVLAQTRWITLLAIVSLAEAAVITSAAPGGASDYQPAVMDSLMAEYPVVVNVSNAGKRLLLKTRYATDFELEVRDIASGITIRKTRLADTQLLLSWRPDDRAIAYVSGHDGNRKHEVHVWNLRTNKDESLPFPILRAANLPLRWSPDGRYLAYFSEASRGGLIVLARLGDRVVRTLLASNDDISGYEWAPSGRQLAVIDQAYPGHLTLVSMGSKRIRRLLVKRGATLQELAWSPVGDRLLLIVTRSGRKFAELVEFDLTSGATRTRVAEDGDVSDPHYLSHDGRFICVVNRNGNRTALVGARTGTPRPIEPAAARFRFLGTDSAGRKVLAGITTATYPEIIALVPVDGGTSVAVYNPPALARLAVTPPDTVYLYSDDGMRFPAYVWHAPRRTGRKPGAIVRVHGGPHLQFDRAWDPLIPIAMAAGIDVIYPNYRGSSGYGVEFREAGDDEKRASDVLAACLYARGVLGVESRRTLLYGKSYGATLAARAAISDLNSIGVLALAGISPSLGELRKVMDPPFKVLLFQGQNDFLEPGAARLTVEGLFGGNVFTGHGSAHVLQGEGHSTHRTSSWAIINSQLIESLDDWIGPSGN
jgi:dipeptidyl aminopeptidase/acylaminoacyl peptidase